MLHAISLGGIMGSHSQPRPGAVPPLIQHLPPEPPPAQYLPQYYLAPEWQPPAQPPYPPQYAPAGYPPGPAKRTGFTDAWCLVIATAGAAVGVFLPWATVTIFAAQISLMGSSTGDGQLYLGVAAVSGLFALLIATDNGGKKLAIVTLIGGAVIGAGGLYDYGTISNLASQNAASVQPGYGLLLTVGGGIGMFVISIVVLRHKTA